MQGLYIVRGCFLMQVLHADFYSNRQKDLTWRRRGVHVWLICSRASSADCCCCWQYGGTLLSCNLHRPYALVIAILLLGSPLLMAGGPTPACAYARFAHSSCTTYTAILTLSLSLRAQFLVAAGNPAKVKPHAGTHARRHARTHARCCC